MPIKKRKKSPSQIRNTEKWLAKQKLDSRCDVAYVHDLLKRNTNAAK